MVWLVYAIVVAALVSTTTLSRYMTTVTGTGTASVASVALGGTFNIDVSNMIPGMSKGVSFNVTNEKDGAVSDVVQDYTIIVTTTGNLPLSFTLTTAATPSTDYALTLVQDGNTYTWSGGRLPHTTETTHSYTLTAVWPANATDPKYAREVDAVTLTVNAQQAQPS